MCGTHLFICVWTAGILLVLFSGVDDLENLQGAPEYEWAQASILRSRKGPQVNHRWGFRACRASDTSYNAIISFWNHPQPAHSSSYCSWNTGLERRVCFRISEFSLIILSWTIFWESFVPTQPLQGVLFGSAMTFTLWDCMVSSRPSSFLAQKQHLLWLMCSSYLEVFNSHHLGKLPSPRFLPFQGLLLLREEETYLILLKYFPTS